MAVASAGAQRESLTCEIDDTLSWSAQSDMVVETQTLQWAPLQTTRVPIKLPPLRVQTNGFLFPEAASWIPKAAPNPKPAIAGRIGEEDPAASLKKSRRRIGKHARIKPPNDIVKLQDRLYYLLQPPLDLLVGSGQLNFPFEPFPYQLDGIAYLFPRYACVLADEMGLGKTMQAISTMRMLLCSGELRSILLVCPKPLVSNWIREFSVWAPEIPVSAIEGNAAKREFQWRAPEFPVKIANYELLMRDKEIVLEGGLHFDLVALDEAQRIKNSSNSTSEIVKAIPRTRSWALTGTPVENSPDDLVGIFDFLSPGYLTAGMPLPQMAKAASDYILRRTKDMVLDDMPPKLFRDADVDLTPEQWQRYEAAETEGIVHLEELEESLTIQHVFELVLRLKQICNFDPVTGASAKLQRLEADMEEVAASGHKAILFSQWTKTIEKMKPALARYNPLEYHGKIPHKQREQVIDRFKNDPDANIILMSYGAGSVGLNLQFCRYVFLFDRWWNPAIEDQAINRAHRIGAAGSVTVTRMMAANTIEQRIAAVLDEKREMFDALFATQHSNEVATKPHKNSPLSRTGGLSRDEIFGLFDLRAPGGKKVA
ncbi:Helicase conserved C-terminal domain-containing protein [Neorhodopirellula lusitana]|uniref:Helicase conserved C-terminal domain-containing protein n=2 Tax=Neorhodopirellula lusitana TaxID=445327 RepID=A0ABY1Q565_9BACT|nr:DEAD/DEAH box helicase [Neorhodopirellula lusitana]SMP58908.1 Helicase conserved C-terminal domain-containing protein [Neorhodopirellula lusitana]